MRLLVPLLFLAVVVLAAYGPAVSGPVLPQAPADTSWAWPSPAENLQVLPADTPPERLREVMQGMTASLGVRCQYCHVGEEGTDFLEWDFAADSKPMKETARAMMEMTWQINTQTLPAIDALGEAEAWRVTCYRGATTPDT